MVKSSIELVKPKNLLKNLQRTGDIIDIVVAAAKKFPNLEKVKLNPSLAEFICNIIENAYDNKTVSDKKLNKKDILFSVYEKLFPGLSAAEKQQISDIVEDLHSNGRIVKITKLRKCFYHLKNFFLKNKSKN